MRVIYLLAGLACVAVGGLGVIVPGLPTTVFFIMAAWCFSKSSKRLENWVLNLPGIGPMVKDYRAGLGMPKRAKLIAISCVVVAVGLSAGLAISSLPVRLGVLALGVVGVSYIALRVPTREAVLAERAAAEQLQAPPASAV